MTKGEVLAWLRNTVRKFMDTPWVVVPVPVSTLIALHRIIEDGDKCKDENTGQNTSQR